MFRISTSNQCQLMLIRIKAGAIVNFRTAFCLIKENAPKTRALSYEYNRDALVTSTIMSTEDGTSKRRKFISELKLKVRYDTSCTGNNF